MPTCERLDQSIKPCRYYQPGGFCNLSLYFRCLEYIKRNEMELSYSSMNNWGRCKHKYYLSNIRGLELVDKPIRMLAGSIMSECLDIIHSNVKQKFTWKDKIFSYMKPVDKENEGKFNPELAKITAILRAYEGLPISEPKGITQAEWHWQVDGYPKLHGFMDLTIQGGSIGYEFKYSANPNNYTKFIVEDQLGTYFLGKEKCKRITLRTIQVPSLRPGKGETEEEFIDRMYQDIRRRPKAYFVDVNYWREEFDLEKVKEKALWIAREIQDSAQRGPKGFYQNKMACFAPGVCEFLSACETGVISDSVYKLRG